MIFQAFIRHLTRHPWQLALALVGVGVGVAVMVAVRLTQHSAHDAFDTATRALSGTATHRIIGVDGTVDEALIAKLALDYPGVNFAPTIKATVRTLATEHADLRLYGIEPIGLRLNERYDPRMRITTGWLNLLIEPAAVGMNHRRAAALQMTLGDWIELQAGQQTIRLKLVAILPLVGAPGGVPDDTLLVDIATAQELLGHYGRVSYCDVDIRRRDDTLAQRLAGALPSSYELVELEVETDRLKALTDAFYTNLTALSLLAMLVGLFLIHNTAAFMVVQRRTLIGRLLALGVTRRQILAASLGEATMLGIAGSALGCVAGYLLATGLLRVVSRTVNDLYFDSTSTQVVIDPTTLLLGFAIGTTMTVFGALLPAAHIARQNPVDALRDVAKVGHRARMTRWLAVVGLVCAACGALMLVLPSRDLVLAFSALGLVTVGLALLVPASVIAFVSVCNGFIRSDRLLPERLGCQTVGATINRTGTAAAALMIASATGVGIGIMVLSFRVSVSDWLDDVLRADFYVSGTATAISADNAPIDAVLIDAIRAINAVAATSTVLRTKARGPRGEFRLSAFELPAPARLGFRFLRGAPQAVWARWELEDVVIVTEPLAYHNRLSVGDELSLRTQAGLVAFRVVGVYADYATEHGSISMSRATHDRHWEDQRYDGIGVYAREGAPLGALSDAISTLTANRPDLEVHARQRLKETSLTIFDRTFLITDVLRLVAIVVAFVGVFGALLAQQLERIREYGTFRALGFSDGELGRVVMTQTGVIGVTAATLALPVGVLLAVLLIDVINVRSFGWSMTLHVPGSYLIQSWVITVAAALLAGIYPAYKAINIPPAVALREE